MIDAVNDATRAESNSAPWGAIALAAAAPLACALEVLAFARAPGGSSLAVALIAFAVCIGGAFACAREKRRDDERTHLIAHAGAGLATLCAVLVLAFAVPVLALV